MIYVTKTLEKYVMERWLQTVKGVNNPSKIKHPHAQQIVGYS